MTPHTDTKYFEGQPIRTVWDADEDKLYFSIIDVVQVLTVQPDYQLARNYWKVLKNRLSKNEDQSVTNCNRLKLLAADGKMRLTDVADSCQMLEIIQSIPSQNFRY